MYLCNANLGLSKDGTIHFNFTDCNETKHHNETAALRDSNGAMQYTVAVVFVYSVAVIGVFALYHRKRFRKDNTDNVTNAFLKNYEDIRRNCEQRSRLGAVCALLQQLHGDPVRNNSTNNGRPSVNSLAFLPMSLSNFHTPLCTDEEETRTFDPFIAIDINTDDPEILDDPVHTSDGTFDTSQTSSGRMKHSMLGSSRRSYTQRTSTCRDCLVNKGVVIPRDRCSCQLVQLNVKEKLNNERKDLSKDGSSTSSFGNGPQVVYL